MSGGDVEDQAEDVPYLDEPSWPHVSGELVDTTDRDRSYVLALSG
jgi:hypothetical protein